MISQFREKLKESRIGATSTSRLEWALRTLDMRINMSLARDQEQAIIDAADSMIRCKECQKTGTEAVNCYITTISVENGRIYQNNGLCKKAQAYLAARNLEHMLSGTGIGKRFKKRRFETFEVTNRNKAAYEMCKHFCDTFKADSTGILLTGGYGTGKTHLAAAIINEMIKQNIVGAFVVVADLMRLIRRSFDEKENVDLQKVFDTVKKSELLVLDDLGAEKSSDWVREQLFILINARYENMLPTVITTNKKLEELAENNVLGQRIASRIAEMTDGVMINVDDYRLRKLSLVSGGK